MSAHPPDDADGTARAEVLRALQRVVQETDRYVDEVGARHGSARTDLEAVAAVVEADRRGEEHSPGTLSRHLGLSSPATTALLDRLERSGHVRRARSGTDRRRVVVEVTDVARDLGRDVFSPMAAELRAVLARYDGEELALLGRFLDEAADAVARGRRPTDG
ncbi:MarR family transcriptional regulator [uncultured Pseudokineococcus sp.]|uniref:MarR family winged helix-turn-helix transcriptional regulator n=1 Tax=uncultured Pseudokineococcus sp. TaxID=1642928 RepID=UPI00262947DA|nr:MarR family transcriptional regulator [uncultured Pseudokineococcus sp.]